MKRVLALALAIVLLSAPIVQAHAATLPASPIVYALNEWNTTTKKVDLYSQKVDVILVNYSPSMVTEDGELMIAFSWGGQGYCFFVPFDDAILFAADIIEKYDWAGGQFVAYGSDESFSFGLVDSINTRKEVAVLLKILYLVSFSE